MNLLRVTALAALTMTQTQAPAQTRVQPAARTILVWSFGFSPSPIRLAAGQPVTLTFVNRSGVSHDFSAERFFASARITSGEARDGEVELGPHETATVTLIPRAGTYPAHCSHFLHKQMGMSASIVVD